MLIQLQRSRSLGGNEVAGPCFTSVGRMWKCLKVEQQKNTYKGLGALFIPALQFSLLKINNNSQQSSIEMALDLLN